MELSRKLSNYLRYHAEYYGEDGTFIPDPWRLRDFGGPHFHAHTIGLLSMIEYALAAQDKEFLQFCLRSYEWGKTKGLGSDLIGFFPENISPDCKTVETCEVADMIAIALKLSQAGVADCWDDADRWIRNQFFENQLTETEWIYELAAQQPPRPKLEYNETSNRVAERNLGAFASWAPANEFGTGIMHCCTGNAARAVYYIWDSILAHENGTLWLNLLMNRASRWADVYSHIPYEGKVELKIKRDLNLVMIRVPQWINSGDASVQLQVNGSSKAVKWEGRYIDCGKVVTGDRIMLTFPISITTVKETIGGVPYTLTLKGNTVIKIDPPGKHGALFNREYYSGSRAPMRTVERFVSDTDIHW